MEYYKGEAFKIYDKVVKTISGGKNYYTTNKIYKLNESRYVYINSHGYLHALIPTRVSYDGKFAYYAITNYLLNRDGMLVATKEVGNYQTREETIKAILNWFN